MSKEKYQVKMDPLYDIQTVALLLSVHENTVRKLIREKKLEVYLISDRALRIPESSILRYLEGRKVDPEDALAICSDQ